MITLLTHTDLDGAGAAVLARLTFEEKDLEIKYCNYDDIDKYIHLCLDQGEAEQLFIVDIAPQSEEVFDRLDKIHAAGGLEIVCLDHHKTSLALLTRPWGNHDAESCGTEMFLRWLMHHDYLVESGAMVRFVLAVKAYDTWELDAPSRKRGEMLHRLCGFMGLERFVATFADNLDADMETVMEELDEMLIDRQKRYVERVIDGLKDEAHFSIDSMKRCYAVTFCEKNFSMVGHEVLDRFPQVLYVVNLEPTNNVCQMRSRKGEIDVSKIAKHSGGGGHPAASGFPFTLREVLLRAIHERLQLLPD